MAPPFHLLEGRGDKKQQLPLTTRSLPPPTYGQLTIQKLKLILNSPHLRVNAMGHQRECPSSGLLLWDQGERYSVLDSSLLSSLPSPLFLEEFLRQSHLSIPELLERSLEVIQPNFLIPKRRKLRLTECKWLAREHTPNVWWNQDWGLGHLNPTPLLWYFVLGMTFLLLPSGAGSVKKQSLHSKKKTGN